MLGHLLTLLLGILFGAIAVLVIAPSPFSRRFRFGVGAGLLALGLVCFLEVLPSETPRVARPRTLILHHHYVTSDESAPRQALPLALLGILAATAVLVLVRSREERPAPMDPKSLCVLATGIVLARFLVEKCAASESIASTFGVLWLAPALGVRDVLVNPGSTLFERWKRIAGISLVLRLPVVAATLVATYYDLGTHFSLVRVQRFEIPFVDDRIFCGAIDERQMLFLVLLPQLVFWPILMAIVGAAVSAGMTRIPANYQRWNAG